MRAALIITLSCFFALALLEADVREDAREVASRYRQAFALAGSLPRDPDEFVRTATRQDVAKLEQALDLLRENVGAESVDWGIDWEKENSVGVLSPHLGQCRNLARLGVAYHEEKLKRGEHHRFVGDMTALLRAGRLLAEGQPLIHFLTSLATEGLVRAAVARNATQLPPDVRAEMIAAWRATPPAPTMVEVLKTERLAMRGELLGHDGMLNDLLENAEGDRQKAIDEHLANRDAEIARIMPFLETSYADLPDPDEVAEGLGELGKILAPTFLRVRRTELGGQAFEELLIAGFNQLRNPGDPLPVSEVTGDRIVLKVTDGALILQSTILIRDKPMQLEFPLRGDRRNFPAR